MLIEATSNQVDQFGGYTGLRPADFRKLVEDIAHRVGFPGDRIVLGGDHLGPQPWRVAAAATAMSHAEELVRSYVAAGYTKLHLDCSYPCADDVGPLTDEVVAARAARMLAAAEDEAARVGPGRAARATSSEPRCPLPGGADARDRRPRARPRPIVREPPCEHHRHAFDRSGLGHAGLR